MSYFRGKSHFGEDGTQNYLMFQPIFRYFKANIDYILSWKPKGLSDETITPYATSDNSLNLLIDYYGSKVRVKFAESCLKQSKISYIHGKVVNIYIVYQLDASSSHNNDPTLKKCLFGAVTSTKNIDFDKYEYSGYGIGFDKRSSFSIPGAGFGPNVSFLGLTCVLLLILIIRKKTLILGKGPTQGLEHTLTAEKLYSINFTVTKKKFCLSLHYSGANSDLLVNRAEI